jgi:hypothetical protein
LSFYLGTGSLEILHFDFLLGEVVGILSGLLLCALGFAIGKTVSGAKGW